MHEQYKIYNSSVITNNYEKFVKDCEIVYSMYKEIYQNEDSTWNYQNYNLFQLSSSSAYFYDFYKELSGFIRDYIGPHKRIWMESWINFHPYENIKALDYHDHNFDYHGYVSIDPKNTTTVFPNAGYEIENKPGQVYIGFGGTGYEHAVKVNEIYEGSRITIAFDLSIRENMQYYNSHLYPLI